MTTPLFYHRRLDDSLQIWMHPGLEKALWASARASFPVTRTRRHGHESGALSADPAPLHDVGGLTAGSCRSQVCLQHPSPSPRPLLVDTGDYMTRVGINDVDSVG